MKIAIVGNGILGLSAAHQILKTSESTKIVIFGRRDRAGAGSAAAAAMLNSFAEIETNYLDHEVNRRRFEQSRSAAKLWTQLILCLENESGTKIPHGLGTFLIAENRRGSLESDNFETILNVLNTCKEEHSFPDLNDIPGYKPTIEGMASRAIYINNEGWVDVKPTLDAFEKSLLNQGAIFVEENIFQIEKPNESEAIKLVSELGNHYKFDKVLVVAGAQSRNFLQSLGATDNNPYVLYGVGNTIRLKVENLGQKHVIRTPNRGLACGLYSAPYLPAQLVIGATNHVTDNPKFGPGVEEIQSLLTMTQKELNSDLSFSEIIKISTGWRPISSDGVPIIGKTSINNVYVCTGTRRDGWHLSPFLSAKIAEMMCTDKVPEDLEIYRMDRAPYRFISVSDSIRLATSHYMSGMHQHGLRLPRGSYSEHIERNYELFFTKLHEELQLNDYGIPVELMGFVASKLGQGVKVRI